MRRPSVVLPAGVRKEQCHRHHDGGGDRAHDQPDDAPAPPWARQHPYSLFSAAAAWMSALNAPSSIDSPSRTSMARLTLPSRLALNRPAGSSSDAPLKNVSLTTFLYASPVQMPPSWDHTAVPPLVGLTHFHSSTTSGSACLISARSRARVVPRQSSNSAIRASISWEGVFSSIVVAHPRLARRWSVLEGR